MQLEYTYFRTFSHFHAAFKALCPQQNAHGYVYRSGAHVHFELLPGRLWSPSCMGGVG